MTLRRIPNLGSLPMRGLDDVKANETAAVVVVTPDCYLHAKTLFPSTVVVSWTGKVHRWKSTDWKPIATKGRSITLIPDYTPDGINAFIGGEEGMNRRFDGLADVLRRGEAIVKIVQIPPSVPYGWSLKTSGWDAKTAVEYCRNNRETSHPPYVPPAEIPNPLEGNEHFSCLGYDHDEYYFFSHGKRQVVQFTTPTNAVLLQLAPLGFWQQHFKGNYRSEFSLTQAANYIFQLAHKGRIYSRDSARGVGAWWDAGRAVVHLGESLVVDGVPTEIREFKSKYLYERAHEISPPLSNPLADEEASKFLHLCDMLPWEHPIDGLLFAGGIAIAPICGALPWRPHIWLRGKAGSGKTWVYENILKVALSGFSLSVLANTTEAGLRGFLKTDALPVIFDEIKSNTENAASRIKNVLGLMRQASAESSAKILKGTADGGSKSFVIHSMFFIASVTIETEDEQDSSRITVLSLNNPRNRTADQFTRLQKARAELLTESYVQRLHARTIGLIPIIRKNAETFAIATAGILGTRRAGDQVGTLLAGAYSLRSTGLITRAEAEAWVTGRKEKLIVAHEDGTDKVDDAEQCLHWLLGRRITIQTDEPMRRREMTVGEALKIALQTRQQDGLYPPDVKKELHRHGIGVSMDLRYFVVSNSMESTRALMTGSPWDKGWGNLLSNLPGAKKLASPYGFLPGIARRGTWIPRGLLADAPKSGDQTELAIGVTPDGEPDPGDDYER